MQPVMASFCDHPNLGFRIRTGSLSTSREGGGGNRPSLGRTGSISVELLLNLPIWLILIFGTIEFGTVLSRLQQVSLASRVGAEAASRIASLGTGDCMPDEVASAVARQLAGAGIGCAKVILEHNVAGTAAAIGSGADWGARPATALPDVGTYVRVTVLVRWTELAPRLLERIAPSLSAQVLGQSTTRRYQPPSREAS